MKKILKGLMMLLVVTCLCACGSKDKFADDPNRDPILRDWKLSYFTIGKTKTEGIGLPAEPHIEFTETEVIFTNNKKPHKGTWTRLEDGTYDITLEGENKNPHATATVDGDILTFILDGNNNDVVTVFEAK